MKPYRLATPNEIRGAASWWGDNPPIVPAIDLDWFAIGALSLVFG